MARTRRELQKERKNRRRRRPMNDSGRPKPRPKKKRGCFTTFLGIVLILIAVGLLAMDPLKNYMIKRAQDVNAVANFSREEIAKNEAADVTYDFSDVSQLNARDVIFDNFDPSKLPTVGAIAIPSVGMNLPIYKGVSNEGMYLGAGTLTPDQQMGESNYPLASHHSIHKELLFAPLPNVKLGESIYLTDLENIYEYKIYMNELVDATRMDLIAPTENPITTLITCDSSLTARVVVQGELVKKVSLDKADKAMVDAFGIDQTVPE